MSSAEYSVETVHLTHDGLERRARVIVPEHLGDRPGLLVFFHGSRQSGNVMRNFTANTFDELACRLGCVLAYPDGVGRHFNDARRALPEQARRDDIDDVGFTRTLIDLLAESHGIDRDHVTGLGYSNGGQMVMRLLRDAPGLLHAAVVFAATWPAPGHELPGVELPGDLPSEAVANGETEGARPAEAPEWVPTPCLFMHGTADPMAGYQGGAVGIDERSYRGHALSAPESAAKFAGLNGVGGDPELSEPVPGVEVERWGGAPGDAEHAVTELWTLLDAGHVIPSGTETAEMLGPDCDAVIAADVVGDFLERLG